MADTIPGTENRIIKVNLDLTETNILKNETEVTNQIFWTTDNNSAYLEFSTTSDLAYATASLVLKNTSDGSVVQRNLEMNYSPFYYKMREEELERAGNWIGQIVVEKDSKALTSRSFKFHIKGSLLDTAIPSLSDVQNYQKFFKQLNDLNDEMTAYLETATLSEEQRVEAETVRAGLFEGFEASEEVRKQNEVIRQQNETNRIAGFQTYDERVLNLEKDMLLKANKKQEDWITPALSNGATGTIQYRKNSLGNLEFRGVMTSVEGVNSLQFPTGYRVAVSTIIALPTTANNPTLRRINIQPNGATYFLTPYGTAQVSFDNLTIPL